MEILVCSCGYDMDYLTNKIIIQKNGEKIEERLLTSDEVIENLRIIIRGKNNKIIFEEGISLISSSNITIYGDNNYIFIGKSDFGLRFSINMADSDGEPCHNRRVFIGQNCYIGQLYIMVGNDNQKVTIGDDCFISDNVTIRTVDGHTILSCKDMSVQNNECGDVFVANHVWIGSGVRIMKNSVVSTNSIIGSGAIVTKRFNEDNVVLAGVPAKIVKRNTTWDRHALKSYRKGNAKQIV